MFQIPQHSFIIRNNLEANYHLDKDKESHVLKGTKEMNIELTVHDSTFEEYKDYEDKNIKDHDFNHIESEQDTDDLELKDEHNVLKRSVCKPHQEFESECNQCKCAADGQSYSCTQNECMDGGNTSNKEVEVFMENEVRVPDPLFKTKQNLKSTNF